MAQNGPPNLCIRRESPRALNVIIICKSPHTASFVAVARRDSLKEIEMEGNRTTPRRSGQGGSARTAGAEPAKTPVKQRAEAPARTSAKAKVAKPKPVVRTDVETSLTEADRRRMIELAAFYRAERRGFVPGFEAEDWFAAEAEIAAQIPAAPAAKPVRKARKPAG
jgi:Protein of unknown function (DUF2934)